MSEINDLIPEGGAEIALEVYKDSLQPAMQTLGKTLGATFEFISIPFMGLQYLNDKVKINLQHRLNQYKANIEKIPEEKHVEVHHELGVPIIQRLSYTTNDDIAQLFITLLTNASNIDMLSLAHPTFISIIDRMSPDEARILMYIQQEFLRKGDTYIPYVNFRAKPLKDNKSSEKKDSDFDFDEDFSYIELRRWQTIIPQNVHLDFPDKIHLYFANLMSCGVLKDGEDLSLTEKMDSYKQIESIYNLEAIQKEYVPEKYSEVYADYSFFHVTELGQDFINACVNEN